MEIQRARLNSSSLHQLARQASRRFEQQFGRAPRMLAAAPGRVNLIGEHTDYNGGFVLPMAIDRYVVVAGDTSPDNRSVGLVRCQSSAFDDMAEFDITPDLRAGEPDWSNFIRGVVAGIGERGAQVPGFDGYIESNIPPGGGLSSSAALAVAIATLVEEMSAHPLEPLAKAKLCQRAEHQFAGMPCGLMDQLSSVFGRVDNAMLIDCEQEEVRYVPLSRDVSVLVINSSVRHTLADSPYADRRATCQHAAIKLEVPSLRHVSSDRLEALRERLDALEYRRVRHVVTENQRTLAAAQAIAASDWATTGELMYESHASMRDDFEISCRELDVLVESARRIGRSGGVFGARLTGGGFGGSTVTLVRTDHAQLIAESICEDYRTQIGIDPVWFVTPPVAGASLLPFPSVSDPLTE